MNRFVQCRRHLSLFGKSTSKPGLFLKGYNNPHDFVAETKTAKEEIGRLTQVAMKSGDDDIVENIDNLSNRLCLTADLADCIRALHGDEQMARAADDCNQSIATLLEGLNASYELQKPLEDFCENGEAIDQAPEDKRRAAELLLYDFQDSGTLLPPDQRNAYLNVQNDIIHNLAAFQEKAFRPAVYPANGVSAELKRGLVQYEVGQVTKHEGNEYILQYDWLHRHPSREVRKESYLNYYNLPESTSALNGLIAARQKMANQLGYASYAERSLKQTAVRSVNELEYFLMQLSANFRPFVELEKNNLSVKQPDAWDINQQQPHVLQKFAQNRPNLRQYLNFYDVIDGFSRISEVLFNVKLERVQPECSSEIWHRDVLKYRVIHGIEGDYGTLYIDPYTRHDKRASDAQFTVQCGKQLKDKYQNPIIVCSFTVEPNADDKITFDELRTIFHELGHAIHSFLGRTRYQHIFGTRISTDFAEVPSTLFEYFASDRRILSLFMKDPSSGAKLKLGEDQARSLRRNSPIGAINKQYTIYQSLCDLNIHHRTDANVESIIAQLSQQHAPFEADATSNWSSRFSHYALYGSKYYSYLYAQGIASRIWQNLFESDPLNGDAGERLRDGFLAHGNGRKPIDMYRTILNEELEPDALIESIITEFQLNQH